LKNSLWKKQPKRKTTVTKTYSFYDESICPNCANVNVCKNPCWPITWINGKTPCKEPLLSDLVEKIDHERDYNDVLAEMITSENELAQRSFEDILNEKNVRVKGIYAMMFFKIPITSIARLLNLHRSRVYQIIKYRPQALK
jgi:hypothetical protein